MTDDYYIYDLPRLLSRKAVRVDALTREFVRDETWYDSVKLRAGAIVGFLEQNGLLKVPVIQTEIENLRLRLSDLTELGAELVTSGAIDRWEASLDRVGSKKEETDVRYLERQLAKLICMRAPNQ